MTTFKKLFERLRGQNDDVSFMEVKEWSERMENAEIQAKEAVRQAMYARKEYEKRCQRYADQCRRPKFKGGR